MTIAAKLILMDSVNRDETKALVAATCTYLLEEPHSTFIWTQEEWDSLSTEEIIELDEFIDSLDRTEYGFVTLTKDDRHGEVAGYLASQLINISWRG